jgi:hypothetical protein
MCRIWEAVSPGEVIREYQNKPLTSTRQRVLVEFIKGQAGLQSTKALFDSKAARNRLASSSVINSTIQKARRRATVFQFTHTLEHIKLMSLAGLKTGLMVVRGRKERMLSISSKQRLLLIVAGLDVASVDV